MELVDEQTQTLAAGIASRDADELLHGLQEMLKVVADPQQGGRVLRQYVLASPKCVELLTAWEGGSGAPTAVPLMLLVSEMLRHPMGKGEVKSIDGDDVANNTDTKAMVILQARLDKLARTIARTKLKDIYSHLSSSQRSRQKAALKLMSSIVLRGKLIAVEVATNFDFTLEALKKLAQHPFKAPVVNATQGFLNHSTRFFFIEFALSFLVVGDPGLLRWILQKRPLYAGVLHGLAKDEESTVIQVLFVIQEKVMAPASLVPTGLQSAVFGDVALEQLARIAGDELFGDSADLAYKILTSLCTDPSHGLCPEVSTTWEPVNAKAGAYGGNQGRLLRLMLRLRVTEVFRHRDLLLATARSRPKLAAAYLDSVPFSLEPRPSPTWFSAMSLVAELIKISSVPPPFSLMASQGLLIPVLDGPLIRSTLRRILPRTLTKVALNRGLQHVNVLVKHACLRVLLEALLSLEILLDAAFTAANTLSSSEEMGSSISEANYSSKNPGFLTGTLIEERIRIGEEAFRDEKELKKLEWLKLVENIQDTMRATLPDPNILLIIYSTLNSSESQPSDGTQKKRTQNVEVVPAGKRRKKDKGYATEEGDEKSLVNNVDEIKSDREVVEDDQDTSSSEAQTLFQVWGVTAQGDTQSLLHAKVLELLAAYQRVLPVAFADKGFDPFKLLPSDPMRLSLLQQEAFLSLLLSTTGCLQKGSQKNNSTSKFVDLSGSGLMYKHVKPLLKMIVGSNVGRVRNSAYVLASRFMLSTGAFDSNAWEATMWLDHLLRLEGITSNNNREGLFDETHSDQTFLGHIGDAVVGFLSEAVGTVGRTLYKHLDQLFTLLSGNSLGDGSIDVRDKSSGLVAPEFGPFVICALEHTLRVLRSDSKSLSSPQRAAISLYVASVLNHLLQIQTNTRALGIIIRSLLSPDFHSNTGVSNENNPRDIAWVPLQTLYWRACFLLNDGSTTLEPHLKFSTAKTSDESGQLRKILTACKGKEKGEDDDDDISRQRDELVSSLVCAPVDEVSKEFFLIAEVLPKICRGNLSILMSICGLHHGLLTEVDVTPEDVRKAKDRVTERQLIVSNLVMRFSSTDSFRLDPSSSSDSENKVSAIYDCLRSLPFEVLLSAVMDSKEGNIFTREILLCALRSAYPSIHLQDRPVVMRMVLSFIQQLQFLTHADLDKSLCLETCFTFLKKLVVPSETWSSGEEISSEEISLCKLMVGESLAHPALAGFCACSKTRKKSVRLFDAYISDYLKSLLEACSLLELHGKSSSVAQLLGILQETTFSWCKPHIERAMTLFLRGVNSGRVPNDGEITKFKDFDSVHSIVTELAPYAGPQEFLHFISELISCKDVQEPTGGVSLSSLCLEFCRTFFKSCPRIKFKPETVRAVTQDSVVQIFRFVVTEALRSGSEEGDLCLLSALQTPIFFADSSFANSCQFSHLVSLTPIEVLQYCVQHPSIIRSKIARTLVEASTVHQREFGNMLIKEEPTSSGKKLQTSNMASKFLQDKEVLQEQSSAFFVLSDDDLLLLVPAVEVFLAKSHSRPATKVVINVASVYLKVLRKQFKSWDDFVDKFPILTDMSSSILGLLKGEINTTGDFKVAGPFWWEVVKIFKHCLQICPLTSKECVSLLRKLLPKNGLPLANLCIDILKGPESGICNLLLKVYGKVAIVKQILLNMQAQGEESDTLLVSEDGKKKSQAGDIIVRFAANLVSTLGTLFKLTNEMETKLTITFSVSGAPNVAKLLEEYLQAELVEVVDVLNATQLFAPEIVAVFQTFAKSCLRYKFGKVCGMTVLHAFSLHLFTCASKIDDFAVQLRDAATCVLDLLLAHSQFVPYLFSTHTLSNSLPLNLGRHAGKGTVLSSLPSILSLIGSPVVRPVEKNLTMISEKNTTSTESLKSPVVDSEDNKPADDLEGEILILIKLLRSLFQLKMHSNEELSLPPEDLVMLEDLLSMLLAAYGATTSVVDLEILALMRQVELCGGKGFTGLVGMDFLWGEAALKRRRARANEKAQAVDADMESEENLLEDRKRMFREDLVIDPRRSGLSVLCFPAATQLLMANATKTGDKPKGLQGDVEEQRLRMAAYDPNYILPFALHGLSEGCIDAEEFVRLGILAVAMASLSSSDEDMRKLGYEILAKYLTVLEEGPSFKGQPQIRLLLTYVKNTITEPWQQLPFVLMLFAAEASCILVHPESPHYLTITRYLLKGPSMDLEYVPLFHSMFGSGSPRYRSERLWMLRLLACGLTSYQDSRVYRRQFVLEILMSFYSSPLADTFTRKWVLQVIQKAARIRPCVQALVERAGLLPWLALAAVNARDFIVSEQDGTETNDLEAMALEVIESVMRWRFMEQRSLGEGMEELSTVALGLHHFLTHSDTTCKQRAIFRRPTLRIMTFALRLSQRRKKYQTHFSLSLQGVLDVIQWVESEGSDSGFDIETSQETRALALQMLLQCSPPAASTHEDKQLLCQVANWAIPVAIQVLTTSKQLQTDKFQAGKGIEHRLLESSVEKFARWLAATLLLGKQADSDGNKQRYLCATSSSWWSILMENTPSPCMDFHPLNGTLANLIMELQRHIVGDGGFLSIVASLAALWPFSAPFAEDKLQVDDPRQIAKDLVDRLLSQIPAPQEADPSWRWSFNNAWRSKQISESLKTPDKLAMEASSFQTEICRVLIIVFQQLLLGDTLELHRVICQWRKGLGDTSPDQQFCSKGFFERLSSVVEGLHRDTKIQ